MSDWYIIVILAAACAYVSWFLIQHRRRKFTKRQEAIYARVCLLVAAAGFYMWFSYLHRTGAWPF